MYIPRTIDKELIKWKSSINPKPLLLRGTRQVGKTHSVRQFSKQFEHFIEVNFDEDKKIHSLFEGNLSAKEIAENLSALYRLPIKTGQTLIFFDEIQACIPAIQSLRYFYEQMQGLHIIAASSLLEFALSEIPSFGVGRIRSMYMYPLSFNEFLLAFGEDKLLELKQKANPQKPVPDVIHHKLKDYLRKFFIIGGMPEVVSTYVQTSDYLECNQIINDIWISYQDDFAKYKQRVPANRIREVFMSAVIQTGNKFMYSQTQSQDNHKQIKEALDMLILAGLIIPVIHSNANGLPLGAELNYKMRKLLIFDTGIYMKVLNLNINEIILSQDFNLVNRGVIAEMFAGLELIKYQSVYEKSELNYWQRNAKNSNAEVDYVIVRNNTITPIEVKAGTRGAMQSMYLFLNEKNLEKGFRLSLENFAEFEKVEVCPLYAVDLLKS